MIHFDQCESSVLELKGTIPTNNQILKTVVSKNHNLTIITFYSDSAKLVLLVKAC
jgi:hypothetical protein